MPIKHIGIFYLIEMYLYLTCFSPSMVGKSQRNWLPEQRVVERHTVCKKRISQNFIKLQMPPFSHYRCASRVNGSVSQ